MNPTLAARIAEMQLDQRNKDYHSVKPRTKKEMDAIGDLVKQVISVALNPVGEAWLTCADQNALQTDLGLTPDQRATFAGRIFRLRIEKADEEAKDARHVNLVAESRPGDLDNPRTHLIGYLVIGATEDQKQSISISDRIWESRPGDPEFDDFEVLVHHFLSSKTQD
jgi:hypothetical protein